MIEKPTLIDTMVRAMRWEAEDILSIELQPLDGGMLPQFEAGAHIDVHLPISIVRSYSLIGSPENRGSYSIAVALDVHSRGGSRFFHECVRPGQRMAVTGPRNQFRYFEGASKSMFIAGGIGITPIWAMIQRAETLKADWHLHYCARSRRRTAFSRDLERLSGARRRVDFHFDDEMNGTFLDIRGLLKEVDKGVHLYCCGPQSMLAAFGAASMDRSPEYVHVEYFVPKAAPVIHGGFTVVLRRIGRSIAVLPGQTILDALIGAGFDLPYSCKEGVCGTCEVLVLDGIPDHRDSVLTEGERSSNRTMMICCSGSKTPEIGLDL